MQSNLENETESQKADSDLTRYMKWVGKYAKMSADLLVDLFGASGIMIVVTKRVTPSKLTVVTAAIGDIPDPKSILSVIDYALEEKKRKFL